MMKFKCQFTLGAMVLALMTIVPSVAQASTPSASHTHAHLFHDRTPRVHDHGTHAHHS
jgi:hypothetical protein